MYKLNICMSQSFRCEMSAITYGFKIYVYLYTISKMLDFKPFFVQINKKFHLKYISLSRKGLF